MIKLILQAAVEISGCHLELRAAPFNFPYKKELFSGNRRIPRFFLSPYSPFLGSFSPTKGISPYIWKHWWKHIWKHQGRNLRHWSICQFSIKKKFFLKNFVAIVPRCNCIRSPLMDDNIRIVVLRYSPEIIFLIEVQMVNKLSYNKADKESRNVHIPRKPISPSHTPRRL